MRTLLPISLVAFLAFCFPAGAQIRIGNVPTTNTVAGAYFLVSMGSGGTGAARLLSWETLLASLSSTNINVSNVVAVAFFGNAQGLTNFARFTNLLFGTATGTNVIAQHFYGDGLGLTNLASGATAIPLYSGYGPPMGIVSANPGSLYADLLGGEGWGPWYKTTGSNTTEGWEGIPTQAQVDTIITAYLASPVVPVATRSTRSTRIVGSIAGTAQSGTFRVPTNVTTIVVEVFGAGGAGNASAGGSAGGYVKKTFTVTTGQEFTWSIGAHPGTTTCATNLTAGAGADAGGAAGTASGGDINIAGTVGDASFGGYNAAVGVKLGPNSRNDLASGQLPCAGGGPGAIGFLYGAPSVILIEY